MISFTTCFLSFS